MPTPFIPIIALGGLGYEAWKAYQPDPDSYAFGTSPQYRTREAAVENYVQHIRTMKWPDDLVEVLELEATFAPADNAEEVYLHMLREGPVILDDMQYSVEDVRKWNKVQVWLAEAAEASGATMAALDEATTAAVIKGTVTQSAQDAKDVGVWTAGVIKDITTAGRKATETAAKNPWPTVVGIGLVVYALNRAKII